MKSDAWFFVAVTLFLAVTAVSLVAPVLHAGPSPSGHGSWHRIVCRTDGQTITCPR